MLRTIALTTLLSLGACVGMDREGVGSDAPGTTLARATLVAPDGAVRGTAILTGTGSAMRLTVDATGLSPGSHGLHVHSVGRCDPRAFDSAGPHWNPAMKQHGRNNPMGTHDGDLPNLEIGSDGKGSVSIDLPGTVAMLLDADGAAVVIHAAADDYRTDPGGNSGARIACGVFVDG